MTWVLAASMGLQAVGALVEGDAAQASHRQAAASHDYNAEIARQNAEQAYALSGAQEALQRKKARIVLGEQAAQIAESGVTYSGSALQVAMQSAADAELDSLLILHAGDLRARGYLEQATSEHYAGDIERANARAARRAMYFNAVAGPLATYARSGGGGNVQPTTIVGSMNAYGGGPLTSGPAGMW